MIDSKDFCIKGATSEYDAVIRHLERGRIIPEKTQRSIAVKDNNSRYLFPNDRESGNAESEALKQIKQGKVPKDN